MSRKCVCYPVPQIIVPFKNHIVCLCHTIRRGKHFVVIMIVDGNKGGLHSDGGRIVYVHGIITICASAKNMSAVAMVFQTKKHAHGGGQFVKHTNT